MPVLYFTVTTDLSYDQRMIRICTSLAMAGYEVVIVGRSQISSIPLVKQPYNQKRLSCFFHKGKLFYAEYNIRLFFYLLFKKMNGLCAIDLDTILPCYYISRLKKIPRIYDAHELFCEMKEIVDRPFIHKIWKWIEQSTVPYFKYGYTVNAIIANEFKNMYGNNYEVIRNIARYEPPVQTKKQKFILYQGAVNEGRSFETLIPAMRFVDAPLYICGDGNFMYKAKKICNEYALSNKVFFKGRIEPKALKTITNQAWIGITLFEKDGLSNYYSLANRFFDYMHATTPQICVDYPVYQEINNLHNIAVLINDLSEESLAAELNGLLYDTDKWNRLASNCEKAAKVLNWETEELKLITFYKNIFG